MRAAKSSCEVIDPIEAAYMARLRTILSSRVPGALLTDTFLRIAARQLIEVHDAVTAGASK